MYVLIENDTIKQYPYNINDLRLDNPQISFPQNITTKLLATFDVFPVTPTDRPQYDPASQKLKKVPHQSQSTVAANLEYCYTNSRRTK